MGQQTGGLGAMAMATAKLTLKVALNSVTSNARILSFAAERLYVEETGKDWAKVGAAERALWQQRVAAVVKALIQTVAL